MAIADTVVQKEAYENQQQQINQLNESLQESGVQIQTLQSEHEELLEQLDERTSRIQEAIDGRVSAETALSQMEGQLETMKADLEEAGTLRLTHERTLKEIHDSTDAMRLQARELAEELQAKDLSIESLRAKLHEQDSSIERHRAEITRLQSFRPEFEKLKETVAEKVSALAAAQSQLQQYEQEEVSLQEQLRLRDTTILTGTLEQENLRGEIANQAELIARLQHQVDTSSSELESAKQFEPQAVSLQQQAESIQAQAEDLRTQLRRVSNELEASLDANASMQDRIRQLEEQLHDNAIAMRDLRRKRANVPNLNLDDQRKAA